MVVTVRTSRSGRYIEACAATQGTRTAAEAARRCAGCAGHAVGVADGEVARAEATIQRLPTRKRVTTRRSGMQLTPCWR